MEFQHSFKVGLCGMKIYEKKNISDKIIAFYVVDKNMPLLTQNNHFILRFDVIYASNASFG